jgi:hypothetical protein
MCPLAAVPGTEISELCRGCRISPKRTSKWRARYLAAAEAGFVDQSRCPHGHPNTTSAALVEQVLTVRAAIGWGVSPDLLERCPPSPVVCPLTSAAYPAGSARLRKRSQLPCMIFLTSFS